MLARRLCALVPLLPEIAIASTRLEDFHGDPADRLIVATARHIGATLVTAEQDSRVGRRGGIQVMPPRGADGATALILITVRHDSDTGRQGNSHGI